MRHLFTLLFAIHYITLFSQTYSGYVTMGCSNKPLSDIELEIEGIVDGECVTQVSKTNSNGTFTFNVFSTVTEWRLKIKSEGTSYPKDFTFKSYQGNQESIHFEYLFEPTLILNDGISEETVSPNTRFRSPHYICQDNRNCLFIQPYNELFTTSLESHCFSSQVYELDAQGNRLKSLAKNYFSMNHEYEDISELCLPYKVVLPDESLLDDLGYKFEVVVSQGCCSDVGNCPQGDLMNEVSYFFEIKTTPKNSVDYSFFVPFDIDELNDNNDSPKDGSEKFVTNGIGPTLTPFSTALQKKLIQKDLFEYVTYNLYETQCDTFVLNDKLVCTDTFYMTCPLTYYSFTNFKTSDGEPYFLYKENYEGKCFKVEFIAKNECGEASSFSYFTIAMINDLFDTKNNLKDKTLDLYPNPTNKYLYFPKKYCEENWHFSIFQVSGKLAKRDQVHCQPSSISVEELNPGVYFLKIDELPHKFYKFIKL